MFLTVYEYYLDDFLQHVPYVLKVIIECRPIDRIENSVNVRVCISIVFIREFRRLFCQRSNDGVEIETIVRNSDEIRTIFG